MLSCGSDDETSAINIVGTWNIEMIEFLSDSEEEIRIYDSFLFDDCFFQSKLIIMNNNNITYDYYYVQYNEDTQETICLFDDNRFQNFTWQHLGGSHYRFDYTVGEISYEHVFEIIVNNNIMKMHIEDGSSISHWTRVN